MKGRGQVTPEIERAIVRDYCTPGVTFDAMKAKYDVTHHTINKIRLKWGLRRNKTNAAPTVGAKRVQDGERLTDLTPTLWRCEFCHGPSTDQEGHSGCIARQPHAA